MVAENRQKVESPWCQHKQKIHKTFRIVVYKLYSIDIRAALLIRRRDVGKTLKGDES